MINRSFFKQIVPLKGLQPRAFHLFQSFYCLPVLYMQTKTKIVSIIVFKVELYDLQLFYPLPVELGPGLAPEAHDLHPPASFVITLQQQYSAD